jgi:hypothetical protein
MANDPDRAKEPAVQCATGHREGYMQTCSGGVGSGGSGGRPRSGESFNELYTVQHGNHGMLGREAEVSAYRQV